ncbi:MAG: alpha/beta fold hydrolase [Vibrio sp.]
MNTNSFVNDGIRYTGHYFTLPLDYQEPTAESVQVFARVVEYANETETNKPWLVYFQGGPGFASPRADANHGWMKRALQQFRILLLDPRGTGLSTPMTHETLASLTSEQQATYLSYFRADNIVRDAESIREQWGVKQWAILGQSFGGFCSLTYLSLFPSSLLRSYITGGVPSISRHADDVYRATYKQTQLKNQAFFQRFPQAQKWCQNIADYLLAHEVYLPNGQRFTVEQFQQIGIRFGVSDSFLPTYYSLENAFVTVNGEPVLSYAFLSDMLMAQTYQTNPIYAILHESIYCQNTASHWSAHRMRDEYSQFHYQPGQPFLFTGEMVYPWMFEQYQCLQPLKTAAMRLAEKSDWSMLYSLETLNNNRVPISCAVYADDMFVDMGLTKETLNVIPYSRAWVTNEYEHNGLRADGKRVIDYLIQMGEQTAAELGHKLLK